MKLLRSASGLRNVVLTLALTSAASFVIPSPQCTQLSPSTARPVSSTALQAATVSRASAPTKKVDLKEWEKEYRRKQLEHELLTLYPKRVEVVRALEPYVESQLSKLLLKTGEKAWQPSDFVPDLTKEGWEEEVKEFRERAKGLPDETLVVLVGDMITEEALPTYQTLLNTFEGVDDPSGISESAWAKWSRGWTSEENRHGDLLNRYLYLTGRVDMRAIEVTIQHLITNGFDPKARKDPYKGLVYTSFQERATKISHQNVAHLANQAGDKNLALICSKIAGDESRHEKAYQAFFAKILEMDPEGALESFYTLMQDQITMPACFMTDGKQDDLFDKFSVTAQKIGVYTAVDYANILEHLVQIWDIEHMGGLSGQAAEYQEKLCTLPSRYLRLAEPTLQRVKNKPKSKFSWIFDREA